MVQLPNMSWLPKLHKSPYGSRFTAASHRCTTKPLSRLLTKCLTTIMHCNGIFRNTGIKCYWVIDNSQLVIELLMVTNSTFKAKSVSTFDFSTLYTTIPHDSIKDRINELIEKAFSKRDALYLSVQGRKCVWSNDGRTGVNISKSQLNRLSSK